MFWQTIHIIEIIIWAVMLLSVTYVAFFATADLVSRCVRRKRNKTGDRTADKVNVSELEEALSDADNMPLARFLVLFPTYAEDKVIVGSVKSFLHQSYPDDYYDIVVISDHNSAETNAALSALPVTTLMPVFKESTKAKALQYAMSHVSGDYTHVVIMDADNIAEENLLYRLNASCQKGHRAIQCHRCAKNGNTGVAVLDGISEEINNTIFRSAHNAIGLSSALIGSGMCFDYQWFAANVGKLQTAGEDRELERLLITDHIYIKYEPGIPVYDEKVSDKEAFRHQRQRWLSAQVNALITMMRDLPRAILHMDINYIDKTVQQALVPRSMLIVILVFFSVVMVTMVPVWSAKWWILLIILAVSLVVSIPKQMRTQAMFSHIKLMFQLVGGLFASLHLVNRHNKTFNHTHHGGEE